MGWKKLSSEDQGESMFVKWNKPGIQIEGEWLGSKEGKYGPVGSIKTDKGLLRFPITYQLDNYLEGVLEGQFVNIKYLRSDVSKKTGRTVKVFDVQVYEDDESDKATA